jgi:hypothetical protein
VPLGKTRWHEGEIGRGLRDPRSWVGANDARVSAAARPVPCQSHRRAGYGDKSPLPCYGLGSAAKGSIARTPSGSKRLSAVYS